MGDEPCGIAQQARLWSTVANLTLLKNEIFEIGASFSGEITELVFQALMYWFEVIAMKPYMTPQ